MWRLVSVERYLQGTLPVPTVGNEEGFTLSLVPCNPDKQLLYPNFIGYLRWNNGQITGQFGVNLEDGICSLDKFPSLDPRTLATGLQLLIDIARQQGHIFPR